MAEAKHRVTRPADRLIDRLQSIMINRATLVAQGADVGLYETPAGRYFTFDGATVQPVTQGDALALKGESSRRRRRPPTPATKKTQSGRRFRS